MERRLIAPTVKTPAENFTRRCLPDPDFQRRRHLAPGRRPGLVHPRGVGAHLRTGHSHANGQLLVCTEGVGLVVTRDGTAIRLRACETVWTPAGEEH